MKPSAVILLTTFVSAAWVLRSGDLFLAMMLASAGLCALLVKLGQWAFGPPS